MKDLLKKIIRSLSIKTTKPGETEIGSHVDWSKGLRFGSKSALPPRPFKKLR